MKRIFIPFLSFLLVFSILFSHNAEAKSDETKSYIKWVDFKVTKEALEDTLKYDIDSYNTDSHTSWIALLSYLAVKNGGNFSKYKKEHLKSLTEKLKENKDVRKMSGNEKLYDYYFESYSAVLGGLVGRYTVNGEEKYGLCAFSPFAKGYYYGHSDDFGASRSYGYKRKHLGHDMMAGVGVPIVAVESGYVECSGWNRYGGWRVGIRSFDGKRYYYYAHLRKNHPYNDIYDGKIVNAGEVIGYLGMTGYSTKENTNNINIPHLHIGLQLIFDESQKDGVNQIWIDMYQLISFLEKYRSEVYKDVEKNEYYAKNMIVKLDTPD